MSEHKKFPFVSRMTQRKLRDKDHLDHYIQAHLDHSVDHLDYQAHWITRLTWITTNKPGLKSWIYKTTVITI